MEMGITAFRISIVPSQIKESHMKRLFIVKYVKPTMADITIPIYSTKIIQWQAVNEKSFKTGNQRTISSTTEFPIRFLGATTYKTFAVYCSVYVAQPSFKITWMKRTRETFLRAACDLGELYAAASFCHSPERIFCESFAENALLLLQRKF